MLEIKSTNVTDYADIMKAKGSGKLGSTKEYLKADPVSYFYEKLKREQNPYLRDDMWSEAARRGESEQLIYALQQAKTDPSVADIYNKLNQYGGKLDYDTYMLATALPTLDDSKAETKVDSAGNVIGEYTQKQYASEVLKQTMARWDAEIVEENKDNINWFVKQGAWLAAGANKLASGVLQFGQDIYNLLEGIVFAVNLSDDKGFLDAFADDRGEILSDLKQVIDIATFEFQRKYTSAVDAVKAYEQGYVAGTGSTMAEVIDSTVNAGVGYSTWGRWFNAATESIGYMLPSMLLTIGTGGGSAFGQVAGKGAAMSFGKTVGKRSVAKVISRFGAKAAGMSAKTAAAIKSGIFYTGVFSGMVGDTVKAAGADYKSLSTGQVIGNALLKTLAQKGIEKALGLVLGFSGLDRMIGATANAGSGTLKVAKQATAKGLSAAGIAIGRGAKDMLKEGLEELFQDMSDGIIDTVTGGLYRDRGLETLSIQNLLDSFIVGALTSGVIGAISNAKVILPSNRGIGVDTDGKAYRMGVFQTLNYNDAMRSIADWRNTLNDNKASVSDKADAAFRLNCVVSTLGTVIKAFGSERAEKANSILTAYAKYNESKDKSERNELKKQMSDEDFAKAIYHDFVVKNEQITKQFVADKLLKALEKKAKKLKDNGTTEISDVVTETTTDSSNITSEALSKLKAALKPLGCELIVGTDGNIVTKSDKVVFVPESLVKSGNVAEILKGISYEAATEEVIKALNPKQLKLLQKTYEEVTGQKGTDEQVVTALLFDNSFYLYTLLRVNEGILGDRVIDSQQALEMLSRLDLVVRQSLSTKALKGSAEKAAFDALMQRIKTNMQNALVTFATQYKRLDLGKISNDILPTELKEVIKNHRNVIFSNDIDKCIETAIDETVTNGMPKSQWFDAQISKFIGIANGRYDTLISDAKKKIRSKNYNDRVDAGMLLILMSTLNPDTTKLVYLPTDLNNDSFLLETIASIEEMAGVSFDELKTGSTKNIESMSDEFVAFIKQNGYDYTNSESRFAAIRELLFTKSGNRYTISNTGEIMRVMDKEEFLKPEYFKDETKLMQDIIDGKITKVKDIIKSSIKLNNEIANIPIVYNIEASVKKGTTALWSDNQIIVTANTRKIGDSLMHEITHGTQDLINDRAIDMKLDGLVRGGTDSLFENLTKKREAALEEYVNKNFPVTATFLDIHEEKTISSKLYFMLAGELEAVSKLNSVMFEYGFKLNRTGTELISPDGTTRFKLRNTALSDIISGKGAASRKFEESDYRSKTFEQLYPGKKKFLPIDDDSKVDKYDPNTLEKIKKPMPEMTKNYASYIHNKRIAEENFEFQKLREKMRYQLEHYGQVDPYDLAQYRKLKADKDKKYDITRRQLTAEENAQMERQRQTKQHEIDNKPISKVGSKLTTDMALKENEISNRETIKATATKTTVVSKDRRLSQIREELAQLKNKLEYQQKHYGEVDQYDLNQYTQLIKKQSEIMSEPDNKKSTIVYNKQPGVTRRQLTAEEKAQMERQRQIKESHITKVNKWIAENRTLNPFTEDYTEFNPLIDSNKLNTDTTYANQMKVKFSTPIDELKSNSLDSILQLPEVQKIVKSTSLKINGKPIIFFRGSNFDRTAEDYTDGQLFFSNKLYVANQFAKETLDAVIFDIKADELYIVDAKKHDWLHVPTEWGPLATDNIYSHVKQYYPNKKAILILNANEGLYEQANNIGTNLILIDKVPLVTIGSDIKAFKADTELEYKHKVTKQGLSLSNEFTSSEIEQALKPYIQTNINENLDKRLATDKMAKPEYKNFYDKVAELSPDMQELFNKVTKQLINDEKASKELGASELTQKELTEIMETKAKKKYTSKTISIPKARWSQSNLKYFKRDGIQLKMHSGVANFIEATTANVDKLPKILRDKIIGPRDDLRGTLTYFDIVQYVRNAKTINDYTFQMIAKYVYDNTDASEITYNEMLQLLENLDGIVAAGFTDDILNDELTPDEILKANDDAAKEAASDKEYKKLYDANLKNSRVFSEMLSTGKKTSYVVELDPTQLHSIFLRYYDGTIYSLLRVSKMGRLMAARQQMSDNFVSKKKGSTWNWGANIQQATFDFDKESELIATDDVDDLVDDIDIAEKQQALREYYTAKLAQAFLALPEEDRHGETGATIQKRILSKVQAINYWSDETINEKYIEMLENEQNKQTTLEAKKIIKESELEDVGADIVTGTKKSKGKKQSEWRYQKFAKLTKAANSLISLIGKYKTIYKQLPDNVKAILTQDKNGKYTLNDSYKTASEEYIDELHADVTAIVKRLRGVKRQALTERKTASTTEARLQAKIDELSKENQRLKRNEAQRERRAKGTSLREKTSVIHTVSIKNEDFTFSSRESAPKVIKDLLATSWDTARMSTVKKLSTNKENNVANGKEFFTQNVDALLNLTAVEAEQAAKWLMDAVPENIDDDNYDKFVAVKLYTLGFIFSQSNQGQLFETISANTKQRIERHLNSMATIAGKALAVWGNVQSLINPIDTMMSAHMELAGVELTRGEQEALSQAAKSGDMAYISKVQSDIINRIKKEKIGKQTLSKQILTVRNMSMLSNPLTWLRNITSNFVLKRLNKLSTAIGSKIWKSKTDSGQLKLNKAVDKTIVQFINTNFVDNGMFDTIVDNLSKYNPSDIQGKFKNATGSISKDAIFAQMVIKSMYNKFYSENMFKSKFMNDVHGFLMKMLSDNNYVREAAIRYFGQILAEKGYDLTKGISDEIMTDFATAIGMSMSDYMHSNNFLNQFEMIIAEKGAGWHFAYKLLMPFAATSWNWLKAAVTYSPVGLATSIYKLHKLNKSIDKANKSWAEGKSQISPELTEYMIRRNLGSGLIGTVSLFLGIALSALGFISLDDDDYGVPKLRIGALSVDVSSIFGTDSLLAGAAFMQTIKDNGLSLNSVVDSLDASLDVILDGFFLTDIMTLDLYSGGGTFATGLDFLESTLLSFIPNALAYVAGATYTGNLKKTKLWHKAAAKVPFLANVVPKKVNPYTGDSGDVWDLVNRILPYFDIKIKSNVESMSEAVGLNKTQLTGKYTINDQKFELSPHETAEINKQYGQWNAKELTDFYSGKTRYKVKDGTGYKTLSYNQMTDKQRKNTAQNIMSKNAENAKILAWLNAGYKYYASSDKYAELKALGIKGKLYIGNKGFVKA